MIVGGFELKKPMGEGAFGRTYYAEHVLLGAEFPACIKQEKTQQEPYITMFRREAEILAKLRHFSLPTLLDYREEGGDVGQVMVLSFIEGKTLRETVGDGFVDDEHICWILDRLLGALDYLHGQWQIVHGDIKPANALLSIEDHQVTLVDLGMAVAEPDEFTKAKGGTPGYIPPEFALGFPPIPASDFYSVGKLGIFLAGGKVESGEPPADMAPELAALLSELVRRDPTERPQRAGELRNRIEAVRHKAFGRSTCREAFKRR